MAQSGDCGLSILGHVVLRTKRLCYSTSHTLDMDPLVTYYSLSIILEIGKVPHGKFLDMLNIPSNPTSDVSEYLQSWQKWLVQLPTFKWARSPVRPTHLGSFQPSITKYIVGRQLIRICILHARWYLKTLIASDRNLTLFGGLSPLNIVLDTLIFCQDRCYCKTSIRHPWISWTITMKY